MKTTFQSKIVWALLIAIAAFTFPVFAADKTEDQLIAELSGKNEDKVTAAMLQLEKKFPSGTKAIPAIKGLLTDSRSKVRRKAARVLGVLHVDVTDVDLKAITELFKGADPREVMDGLISLRGLKAQSTVPQILPLLKHTTPNVVRDACRTLAVLGGKDVIPSIEPLLTHPDAKVQKDAKDAIFALKAKS